MPQGNANYLIGRSFSACTVAGYTRSSAGLFTVASGSSANLAALGTMDVVSFQRSRNLSKIQPINQNIANYVPIDTDFTITVNEIRAGDGTSALDNIAGSFDYIGVTVSVSPLGGSGVTHTVTVYGVIESCELGADVEKNLTTMTVRPAGVASVSGAPS